MHVRGFGFLCLSVQMSNWVIPSFLWIDDFLAECGLERRHLGSLCDGSWETHERFADEASEDNHIGGLWLVGVSLDMGRGGVDFARVMEGVEVV